MDNFKHLLNMVYLFFSWIDYVIYLDTDII